ncbi:MAG: hypothetical protein FWF59_03500 [Turicibacter sp.]|nr:hypothetical protein [Turicibacter sp.]
MFDNLKKNMSQMAIEKLLKTYGLQLKHFTPGRLRLAMPGWKSREGDLRKLLEEMKQDPDVSAVEFTEVTGSILIAYRESAPMEKAAIDRWRAILEKYR